MKTLVSTGLAAIALATAGSAHAATTVTYDEGPYVTLSSSSDGSTYSGSFAATVGGEGDFATEFFFDVPGNGVVSIAGISILSDIDSNLTFTSGMLDGTIPFTITNGTTDVAQLFMKTIASGSHSFTLDGTFSPGVNQGVGSLGGNVSFALAGAVPEPATWALFILGFGAIGAGMRRRSSQAGKVRASMRFA